MNSGKKLTRREKARLSISASQPVKKSKEEAGLKRLKLLLGIIAGVFGFLLYAATIRYGYTLDDFAAIEKNNLVRKGVEGIGMLLGTSYWEGFQAGNAALYRPLSLVMFAIEWQFFPGNPAAGHFMNVLLYALSGFVVFNFLSRLAEGNLAIPFAAAMLFIAHPVHTEVVASIKSRDEILCFLLSILSAFGLLDYVRTSRIIWLFASGTAFFLALLSKENALTFLAVMPLMLFVFKGVTWKKSLQVLAPHLAATLIFLVIRASVQGGAVVTSAELLTNNILSRSPDFLTTVSTALYVLGRYLLLLVFPYHLSMDYSFNEISLMSASDLRAVASAGVYLALAGYAIFKIRKKDRIAFGILYYLLTISIVSNLVVVIGTVMAERLLYMPSLGFTLVLSLLLARLFDSSPQQEDVSGLIPFLKANEKMFLAMGVILALYSFKTIDRSSVWKDNLGLLQSGVRDAPNSAYVHYLYGNEIMKIAASVAETDSVKRDSLYEEAVAAYKKAIEINPSYPYYYSALGVTYNKKKSPQEAWKYYDLALQLDPRHYQAYQGKGVIAFTQGKFREAAGFFTESLKWNPYDAIALRNAGSCYLQLHEFDRAIRFYEQSLNYDPYSPEVLHYLGIAYQQKGNSAMANKYFEKARNVSPQ